MPAALHPVTELARAKVNLTLHVTGRRPDGYHLLDSLVVFPELGDLIEVEAASGLSLTIDGPFAQDLGTGADNLVLQAAELIRPNGAGAAIHLTKSLPVASGIGGGSADAAATLRALARLWDVPLEGVDVLSLGADVPVCVGSTAVRMQGIGERLTPFEGLPEFWLVLVNPGVGVPTPAVFGALSDPVNPPMSAQSQDFVGWISAQRNDLEPAAISLEPVVGDVLSALKAVRGCQLARMSGSGATCFGLFANEADALAARAGIAEANPLWWCVAAPVKAGASL